MTNKEKERENGTQKGNTETERKWNVYVNSDRRHNVTQTQRERVHDLKWKRRFGTQNRSETQTERIRELK